MPQELVRSVSAGIQITGLGPPPAGVGTSDEV